MAGTYVVYPPNPGEAGGPCKEPCHHIICDLARKTAEHLCEVCQEPIGYGGEVWFANAWLAGWPQHGHCHPKPEEAQSEAQPDQQPAQ